MVGRCIPGWARPRKIFLSGKLAFSTCRVGRCIPWWAGLARRLRYHVLLRNFWKKGGVENTSDIFDYLVVTAVNLVLVTLAHFLSVSNQFIITQGDF